MARVKLSEFRAKSLLSADYAGVSLRTATLAADIKQLDAKTNYVIKVDQGIKKRGKQGLIALNVTKNKAEATIRSLAKKGYNRFLAELTVPHADKDEQYLSLERTRDGLQILHSVRGGVEVEDQPEMIKTYQSISDVPLPQAFLTKLIETMNHEHMSFLEINPLVVKEQQCLLLDAATLVDSAGAWQSSWTDDDIITTHQAGPAEQAVTALNDGSPASFSLRVLNPDGAIWLLLSGGGASITLADEAANQGKADLIGNYGEYSGGPTREETQLYTEEVLRLLHASEASKKALVIAGGVANFTDVRKTFAGIIDAFTAQLDTLQSAGIKVFVRRGGPNEKEGLADMKVFLEKHNLLGSVHGSETVLTSVVDEAMEAVDA